MKKVTRTTHYWLFKPTGRDKSKYFFIRTVTEGLDKVVWFEGYQSHTGLISSIGGDLMEDLQNSLEKEFQN